MADSFRAVIEQDLAKFAEATGRERVGATAFGMGLLEELRRHEEATISALRQADAERFKNYIGGYEQACWNLRKIILKAMATHP